MSESRRKLLVVAHCGWGIYNFRNSLISKARDYGYEVVLVSPYDEYVPKLKEQGFRWVNWNMKRGSINFYNEISSIKELSDIYINENPDIIHNDTIKPTIYGSISALINSALGRWNNRPSIINSLMGIGSLFSDNIKAKILQVLLLPVLRVSFRYGCDLISFSNNSDLEKFLDMKLIERGKGQVLISEFVNTTRFKPEQEDKRRGETIVLMASRMIWDKGIGELADAARMLKENDVNVQFWAAGKPDPENPRSVPEQKLNEWHEMGIIKWLGHRSDMPELLRRVDIAALPTYYNEGLPRFLVEAAATGLPLVATDMEACRRVVESGWNGFLIPEKDSKSLANKIYRLVENDGLRKEMGKNSRKMVEEKLSERCNLNKWIKIYESNI